MSTAIQRRRGNTAQHANFTGLAGEITIDTDLSTVIVHDGVTQGGIRLAKYTEVQSASEGDITAVNTNAGSGLTGGTASGAANIALDYENLSGNLVPSVNNTYSLGTPDKVWRDVYVGPGSLYVDGQKVLESDAGTIVFTADPSQNISVVTTAGADIELNTGNTGSIQLKGNVVLNAGKTFTTTGGGAFTFTSNITMDSNRINNIGDPVQAQDAATKNYVDTDATVVRVTGAQTIAGAKTFSDNMVINGSLTVTGTTTTVNSETISLADNIIDLNSNFTTGAPTENAGIRIQRGDETAAQLRWNEASDYWETVDGSGATKIALDTDDLAEGSTNVYYTDARAQGAISVVDNGGDGALSYAAGVITYTGPSAAEVRAHLSGGTGITYNSSTGAISADDSVMATKAYVDSQVQSKDALSELSGDTDDVSEGTTNLYYTDARARAAISASGDISYDSATGVISFTNDAGDIESVVAGTGLTGGGTSGDVTLNVDMSVFDTDDLAEGTNLYYTTARANADFDTKLAAADTGDLAEGSNLYYTTARANADFDTKLAAADTDNLSEGSTNQYFTAARARNAVSGGTGISYNSTTGVIALSDTGYVSGVTAGSGLTGGGTDGNVTLNVGAGTGITVAADTVSVNMADFDTDDLAEGATNIYFTDARARGAISVTDNGGDGSLSYNSTTGVISYTGPSAAEVRAHITAGDGIDITAGEVAVDSSVVRTSGDQSIAGVKTFSDSLVINGNLTVSGAQTILNTETLTVDDNIIVLNNNVTGSPTENAGITVERGTSTNAELRWNETNDQWETFDGSGYTKIALDTDDLAEGTNLYFTDARARAAISAGGDLSYNSSTGVISFTERTDAEVRGLVSAGGDLSYNSTTGVFSFTERTDGEVRGLISVTDNGGDGSLSYNSTTGVIAYTGPSAAEVRAHFSAGTGVTISSGSIAIGQAVGTTDNVTFNTVTADLIGDVAGTVSSIANHDTGDLAEGSNLYFTNSRARAAVSGGAGISYNSTTGVIALSDTGYVTGVTAGTGLTGGGTEGTVTLNVSGLTVAHFNGSAIQTGAESFSDSDSVLMTAAAVNDLILSKGYITSQSDNQTLSWNGSTGVLSISGGNSVDLDGRYQPAGSYQAAGSYVTTSSAQALRATDAIQVSNDTITIFKGDGTSEAVSISDATLSTEQVQDIVGAMFAGAGATSVSYNDTAGTITVTSTDTNTDTNWYPTGASFNTSNGVLSISGTGMSTITVDLDGRFTDNGFADTMNQHVRTTDSPTFVQVNAVATSAKYADLAEKYATDADYEPGTVVCFGGEKEVTACAHEAHHAVAGVISTDPAYMMNDEAEGQYVALTGRVPVKVMGPVAKGDLMVSSSVAGHAKADNNAQAGRILGKAISAHEGEGAGVIEVLITLM
jgi:hypothetical protein